MKKIISDEIVTILHKLEEKKTLTDDERLKLDTFLQTLETGMVNPACKSKILVNPLPNDFDASDPPERNLEDRIKHINTVSARVRESMRPETEEESQDFDVPDPFDIGAPKSVFEVSDHFKPMEEETLEPIEVKIEPNPDVEVEPPPPEKGGETITA